MIKLDVLEPQSDAWRAWRRRCNKAQPRLNAEIEAWLRRERSTKPEVNEKLYKDQKHTFYIISRSPFLGKCAYCETKIVTGMHGDLDHFRPKAAVTERDMTPIQVEIDGVIQTHPGYYWLAYDWTNLVPFCQLCNQPSTARSPGSRIGKWDYFPISGDVRAVRPGEEANEHPLLINPLWEDPALHLGLEPNGVMFPRTERGDACIDVFGLNLRDLPNARADVYESTRDKLDAYRRELRYDQQSERAQRMGDRLHAIKQGHEPHTIAARLAFRDDRAAMQQFMDTWA